MGKSITYTTYSGENNIDLANRLHQPDRQDSSVELSATQNIDLDNTGLPLRRPGQTVKVEGACSSFFSNGTTALLVSDGDLNLVNDDFSLTPMVESIGTDLLSLDAIDGVTVFSSPTINGIVAAGTGAEFPTPSIPDKSVPPLAQVVAFAFGRWWFGVGSDLYCSEPGSFSIDSRVDPIPIPGTITMIAQTKDGLYIGTLPQTFFLAGQDPFEMTLDEAANSGAVYQALTYIDGAHVLGGKFSGKHPVWISPAGLCIGLPSGQVVNLTGNKYRMPSGDIGALVVVDKGFKQFVGIVGTSAFAVNALTGAATTYTNCPFNSLGVWNDRVYGASDAGLFELTGDDDNGTQIDAFFTIGTTDYGSDMASTLIDAFIEAEAEISLELETNGEAIPYTADSFDSPFRFRFARGVRGKEWKVKVLNVGGGELKPNRSTLNYNPLTRLR